MDHTIKPNIEKDFIPVDPDEIERELLKKANEQIGNAKPEDIASQFFQMYFPRYQSLLGGLSNKDARRVAEHVVQWPLHDENPKFNDDAAEEAFKIGVRLLDAKMIMRNIVEIERAQAQIDAAKAKAAENAVTETPNQGEENGKMGS